MIGWDFLATSLMVVIAPGTGVLYTLAWGLSHGAAAGAVAALGCTLGIVPHMLAAVLGVAALLHASALVFQGVKIAGLCYLLYLAWSMLRADGPLAVPEAGTGPRRPLRRAAPGIVAKGVLANLLNPKLSLFFLAFLPQFVPADAPAATGTMLVLAAAFMAMTLVVFIGYGAAAAAVRRHVIARPAVLRWLRRGFAGAFAGLGVKLAVSEV